LKGLLIGNGWFSPAQQYPSYVSYGQAKGLIKGKDTKVDQIMTRCNQALAGSEGKGHVLVGTCEALIEAVVQAGRKT
jgi:carboxypeptidase D